MKAIKHIHIAAVACALVLMAIPWGVNYVYLETSSTGVVQELVEHYAYYALEPFTNGFVGPFLTLVLTALLLLVLGFSYLTDADKPVAVVMTVLSAAAIVTSFLPLIMGGFDALSITELTVSFVLICSLVMSLQRLTGKYFQNYEDDED